MPLGVIIAVRGARESAIASAVGADKRLVVARRCADLTEALAAAEAGLGSVVVLSEQPHLDRSVVALLATAGVAVLGVPSSPDAADHLRSLGIEDLLPATADAKAIANAAADAASKAPEHETPRPLAPFTPGREGKIVAVWGPTGAPGRTTIAVNIAAELAARCEALLVDADTYGGAVAQAFASLDEAPGLAALARASLHGTLSDHAVERHALTFAPGLRALTGITRADRWPELSQAALDPVWQQLRRHADITVIDCGFSIEQDETLQYDTRAPQRNGAALSALAAADLVVVVGSAEPLAMQRLVNALAMLEHVLPEAHTPRVVVVNRLRAAVAGARPREAVADALRRYSAVEQVWTVDFDARACDASTLAGQSLRERAPRSPARKSIQQLALAVEAAVAAAPVAIPASR
jgi:MinD-like ATPase involved in chromosome partitioning or flagellar assembly